MSERVEVFISQRSVSDTGAWHIVGRQGIFMS